MKDILPLDDRAIIEKALARVHTKEPLIPAHEVRSFLDNIGKEIARTGSLSNEYVDGLLRQLENGSCDVPR